MAHVLSALLGMFALCLMGGSLALWWYAIRCLITGVPLLKFEPRRPVSWGMVDLILIFIIVFATLIGGQALAYYAMGLSPGVPASNASARHLSVTIFSSSISLLAGCVAAVALLVIRGATLRDLGVQARRLLDDVKIGAAAFVMLAPPMYFIQFLLTRIWPSEHPLQTMLMEDPQLGIILGACFTAVIVAPLTEEIFFRLMFQGWMEKVATIASKTMRGAYPMGLEGAEQSQREIASTFLGDGYVVRQTGELPFSEDTQPVPQTEIAETKLDGPAQDQYITPENPYATPMAPTTATESLVTSDLANQPMEQWLLMAIPTGVSAFVFAIMHWGHGPDPVPLFFLALGLGYLYQRTHRIVPCIIVHFLVNSLSMLALIAFLLSGQEPP